MRLRWGAVEDASAYRVEYRESGEIAWLVHGEAHDGTAYVADRLECGTTYEFRVSARADGGPQPWTYGAPSGSVSGMTGPCPFEPQS